MHRSFHSEEPSSVVHVHRRAMKTKKNVALAPDPRKPESVVSPKERWEQEVSRDARHDAGTKSVVGVRQKGGRTNPRGVVPTRNTS